MSWAQRLKRVFRIDITHCRCGIAIAKDQSTGEPKVVYGSGLDVLRQTPNFVDGIQRSHLDGEFEGLYHCIEALFSGQNPYMSAIERSMEYLQEVLRSERWPMLRRDPPCFASEKNPVQNIRSLALDRLKDLWAKP